MKDTNRKKEQLITELVALRQRIAELEKPETERRQVHQKIERAAKEWRTTFDSILDMIFIQDKDFMIVRVNKAFADAFKMKPQEVIGQTCYELVHGLKEPWPDCPHKATLETGKPSRSEFFEPNLQAHIEATCSPIFSEEGEVIASVHIIRDITERKQAEEKLKHLTLVLGAIRNVTQLIAKEKDPERLLTGICDCLTESRGYCNAWIALLDGSEKLVAAAESGLGKEFSSMGEYLKRGELPVCAHRTLNHSGVVVIEDPSSTCAGCPLIPMHADSSAMATRLEYGDKTYGLLVVATLKDYTTNKEDLLLFKEVAGDIAFALHSNELEIQRKKSEEALTIRAQLLDAATDAITVQDLDGNFIYVNEATTRSLGYSKKELLKMNQRQVELTQDDRLFESRLNELMEKGETIFETTSLRKDNSTISVEVHARTLDWGNKKVVLSAIRDITELRKAQEQLQHSQVLSSLGKMTAGIVHEVNNPLGSIILYSELILKGDIPAHGKKDLRAIRNEAIRAAKVMAQLLNYSHKLKPETRRLDLHKVIQKVLDMRYYQQSVQNITLITNLFNGPLYIRGDSSQLMQVFINLILNAEEVLADSKGGTITVTTQPDGEWARVSITDDGTGIPDKYLDQIFFPFFTTKPVGEGTGLGLSACYGIITGHGGVIRAANNEMGGATFTVELPLIEIQGRAQKTGSENKKARVSTTSQNQE